MIHYKNNIDKENFEVLTQGYVRSLMKDKDMMCDKNDNGRALLVAGSHCMAGAAVMAARACIRSGVGVLCVHVPRLCTGIIQTLVPEAVVSEDENDEFFSHAKDVSRYDAVGVGPGLRCNGCTSSGLESLLQGSQKPLAIDADAINIISERRTLLSLLPKGSVLTPHKRELERLVGCLLDNATKYCEKGGKIGVRLIADSSKAKLYVMNTGEPISEEDAAHVFDRFYRSDGARQNPDGVSFGLGLAIARATARAHGGTISCRGVKNSGTVFEVTIPLAKNQYRRRRNEASVVL